MLKTITLTGADERTSISALEKLVADFPGVEIGLLYTANPEGRNRYPGLTWLEGVTRRLGERCAVHVCGGTARKQFLAGELDFMLTGVRRVQLNGNLTFDEVKAACIALPDPGRQQLITQHQDSNSPLSLLDTLDNHALLVDGSGGRGISPAVWKRPDCGAYPKPVGFAGGLGPENLALELPKISLVAGVTKCAHFESWVDMEGKLRSEDWFDHGLARECAEVHRDFIAAELLTLRSTSAPARRMHA